ncbi:MAG: NAD(P)/FAD-dependent oxidoreductase [Chloroflexota bacterium]|nr:NAD(P)/FAD-dependent oxidoreductase [Chloroflexota bacterium]
MPVEVPEARLVDVAIIGAGVVGAAIARELSRYDLEIALIESAPDVGAGTSKANTAILHTGYDAKPASLEAGLVRRGWELFQTLGPELGIPIEPTGAILVAWNDAEVAELDPIQERALTNGDIETRRLGVDELYALEPNLGPGALAGLVVPGESIICAFTVPLAFATQAVENGTRLYLDSPVLAIGRSESGDHIVELPDSRRLMARWVVNAAGLGSDRIDRMLGHDRFTIVPRRGELIVFDKLARSLLKHVLLPVPTKMGKGVLVAPTVYGNVMVGPTAEDLDDRNATDSTAAGLELLRTKGRRILPRLLDEEVTAVYAGLRAATEHPDYQLHLEAEQRYVCVGGIRSTGLTASPAIGEHVAQLVREAGLALRPRDVFRSIRMPNIGEAGPRPYRNATAIADDPEFGRIVCHCERVTRGEIRDALRATIPARTTDGLRRRTRAQMGRCQGFYCSAEITMLLSTGTAADLPTLLAVSQRDVGASIATPGAER